jgi:murein DD-endopeptidase MepM/ murein hydrolase activator NlpD
VNRRFLIVLVVVLAAGMGVLAYAFRQRLEAAAEFDRQVKLAQAEAAQIRKQTILATENRVPAGENFTAALQKFGLSAEDAANASAAAQHAFNLRQVRAGNTITVNRSVEGTLREIDYKIDTDRMLKIVPEERGFSAQVNEIPSKMEVTAFSGRVDDSLFNAIERIGESPELAMRLAQIFGYDLDFYTDPRRGDSFTVVLEKKKYKNGHTAGYGKILAAEYDNGGKKYQALLYHDPAGQAGYYRADGQSLQKMFLRSPLKFSAPVTSHFSKARFHPILKTYRAHMGTDYGACDVRGAQRRRRKHGANRACERLRDDVFALIPDVCARRRTRGNREDHRVGWKHGAFDRAAPGLPYNAKRAIQEF